MITYQLGKTADFLRFVLAKDTRDLLKKIAQVEKPTRENLPPHAHQILDLLDYFLAHELEAEQDKLLTGFFYLWAMKYSFDRYWQERSDNGIAWLAENWKPLTSFMRSQWWSSNVKHNAEKEMPLDERLEKAVAYSRKMRAYLMQIKNPRLAEKMLVIQRLIEGLPIEYDEEELFGELI